MRKLFQQYLGYDPWVNCRSCIFWSLSNTVYVSISNPDHKKALQLVEYCWGRGIFSVQKYNFQDDCKMGVHLSMPFLGSDLCHLSRMSHTVYKILQGYRILSPNFISSRDYKTLLQLVEWCWESSISSLHKSYFLRRLWTWEIKSGNHPSAGSDFCNPSRTRWVPTPVETVSGFYSTW